MKIVFVFTVFLWLMMNFCKNYKEPTFNTENIRGLADTVGFAHLDWQMDSVVKRIKRDFRLELKQAKQPEETVWKAAICPHDDYAYSSWLYPAVLENIKAKTVIIFGVAHKAKLFNLENQIVFDSFIGWHGPYGMVKVSQIREKIEKSLPNDLYVVHDSMQAIEHSVEALIPFMQSQNRDFEIVSILVPYMTMDQINVISDYLSKALNKIILEENLVLGRDIAILITSDAVHYGDEEWGDKNYAPFGTDSAGYSLAVEKEHKIIRDCFTGNITENSADSFHEYTIEPGDFREYLWTWCGRYSIPLGLKTAVKLQQLQDKTVLVGVPIGYQNSIDHKELKVDDISMGKTAIANLRHWVGYAAIGFK